MLKRVFEISILLTTLLLYIATCILGYGYGNSIAIIASAIILITIVPIKNCIKMKIVKVDSLIYYLIIFGIVLFTLIFSIRNIYELINIDSTNGFSIYLKNEVLIGYLLIIISSFIHIFLKKKIYQKKKVNAFLQYLLIIVPPISAIIVSKLIHNQSMEMIPYAVSFVFLISFIIGINFKGSIPITSKLQTLYIFFIVLALLSMNFPAIIILIIMCAQLDKTSINI